MKNVLVISYYFPPLNSSGSRRFGLMTPYMEDYGWKPWVITTRSSDSEAVRIPESQIFRIGDYTGAYARETTRLRNAAGKEALKIRFKMLFPEARAIKKKLTLRSVTTNLLRWYRRVLAYEKTIKESLPKVDLIMASYGPDVALWLGRHFASKYKAPWIADYRDLGALRLDGRRKSVCYLDYRIEKFLLRSARAVTTVSQTLKEVLSQAYGKPGAVIYNGWEKSSLPITANNIDSSLDLAEGMGEDEYVYYAGRLYPHRMKSIFMLLKAMKHREGLKLFLRSRGPKELEKTVLVEARALGIEERIKILPPCSHNQVYYESQCAFANLIFEDLDTANYWSRGSLTAKLFELIASRPAILAIAMSDSEIRQILDLTQKGQLCSTADEIERFFGVIDTKEAKTEGNIDEIQRFSRENQARKLCAIFDEICR